MEFAALAFVGPGEVERERLVDLVDSLLCFEPEIDYLVIIDDSSGLNVPSVVEVPPSCRLVVLPNPRLGRGDWWTGGLCAGLTAGLDWLARNTEVEFVVRVDTDSLVIGPFAARIAERLRADEQAGLLGSYQLSPNGEKKIRTETRQLMAYVIPKLQRPLTLWRHSQRGKRVQCLLRPRDRLAARLAAAAVRNGYQHGEFIQGGGYAVSGRLLAGLKQNGFIADPLAFLPMYFSEDHLATLLCFATGLAPRDFNQPGEVFGVVRAELAAPPEQLLAQGYSIIHAVKSAVEGNERASRDYFRTARRALPARQA